MDASSSCPITSKGQVTIPKVLHQQLGLLRSQRPPVPVDVDPASRLRP